MAGEDEQYAGEAEQQAKEAEQQAGVADQQAGVSEQQAGKADQQAAQISQRGGVRVQCFQLVYFVDFLVLYTKFHVENKHRIPRNSTAKSPLYKMVFQSKNLGIFTRNRKYVRKNTCTIFHACKNVTSVKCIISTVNSLFIELKG